MLDLPAHLDADTQRLVELVLSGDLAAPVTTCGDWTLADLAAHVYEVQHFWHWIVSQRALSPKGYAEPARPPDDELATALDTGRELLVATIRETDPATPCWSWARSQTAGFTRRRQAHEALVHRIDAEMALNEVSSVDARLAADGVDEVLGVFAGEMPEWGTFTPGDASVRLTATDLDGTWTYRFGRMTGTSTETGKYYDVEAIEADDAAIADAHIRATAAELDLWLWGRDRGDGLRVDGERTVATRLRALVADATR